MSIPNHLVLGRCYTRIRTSQVQHHILNFPQDRGIEQCCACSNGIYVIIRLMPMSTCCLRALHVCAFILLYRYKTRGLITYN